jgi:hypothetical protein
VVCAGAFAPLSALFEADQRPRQFRQISHHISATALALRCR